MLAADTYIPAGCSGGMGWGYQMKDQLQMVERRHGGNRLLFSLASYELLEALLAIDAWYTEEVRKLETLLKVERAANDSGMFRNWRRHEQRTNCGSVLSRIMGRS